jgi:hypothetical protein
MNERTFYYIFYTWSHRVKLRDGIIRDIFLINASFKLFTFSFRLVPTLPPPPPLPIPNYNEEEGDETKKMMKSEGGAGKRGRKLTDLLLIFGASEKCEL